MQITTDQYTALLNNAGALGELGEFFTRYTRTYLEAFNIISEDDRALAVIGVYVTDDEASNMFELFPHDVTEVKNGESRIVREEGAKKLLFEAYEFDNALDFCKKWDELVSHAMRFSMIGA